MMRALAAAERHQAGLFLLALAAGAAVGIAVPAVGGAAGPVLMPVLGVLLFLTFLSVPFAGLRDAVSDVRFLVSVMVANFVVVPLVVWALSRFVAGDEALLVGVLLVLLTPCVDYVVVFTGLAGGARDRVLAATPLLMVAQLALLPGYVWLMAAPGTVAAIDPRPFVEAFVLLIVVPLGLAGVTQALAGRSARVRRLAGGVGSGMVPVVMIALFVAASTQTAAVGAALASLAPVVPIFVAFALCAAVVGAVVGRVARLDAPRRRAVVFSAVTRNSLVVLPLALALPGSFAMTPLVVVTQTLVELVVMVVLVAVAPRLVRDRGPAVGAGPGVGS
ncbi:bile acid:sodium symporter [Microbacterium sp. cf332]|uniref:bile acid:sodium symporter n=1 Tax=Microbacterium sp. cf332 TaxID=1761804 RepID=UPI0008803ED2|nr:bile acid:sodium symporter [Microbacterium sp. cf332]SDQ51970.1 Arsenite efflux pump ArsB, ACR3 family [Microbacterium sp. cf332]